MLRKRQPRNPLNNKLRIIAGQWRGRKLPFADSAGLRPTSDRVRETLFNWLSPMIHEARCLDLFSGSGALSLEALSRGAAETLLIDSSSQVCRQLRQNLELLACHNAQVITYDALAWLQTEGKRQAPFDIVFIDPPFNQQLVAPCCELLEHKGLLTRGSAVYIECEAGLTLEPPPNWKLHRQKRAGQVAYQLYLKAS